MMHEFNDRPLVAGTLRGIRSFAVDHKGYLTGVNQRERWMPGENVSECLTDGRINFFRGGIVGDHTGGMLECRCGFYAYFDGSNQYEGWDTITGIVEGYGCVTVGSRGFRAEKARIVALVAPSSNSILGLWTASKAAQELYGDRNPAAKIKLFEDVSEALEEFPLVPPPDFEPGPPPDLLEKSLANQMQQIQNNLRRLGWAIQQSLPILPRGFAQGGVVPAHTHATIKRDEARQVHIVTNYGAQVQMTDEALRVMGLMSEDGIISDDFKGSTEENRKMTPQDHQEKGSGKQSEPFWVKRLDGR